MPRPHPFGERSQATTPSQSSRVPRYLVPMPTPGYLPRMPESIKISEFTDVRGAFHCEHKPTPEATTEKGHAVLCPACSAKHAGGANLQGEGYGLRQTAFGGWVKSKAAAR